MSAKPCYCDDGWVCEEHSDKPWPHDDCAGPGMPCECGAAFVDKAKPDKGGMMLGEIYAHNEVDGDGNPTGGYANGIGLSIQWQNGPLGRGDERREPNGAFVETVIAAAKQRLEFYQTASGGKFACIENFQALVALDEALTKLNERTQARETREVEGTHVP